MEEEEEFHLQMSKCSKMKNKKKLIHYFFIFDPAAVQSAVRVTVRSQVTSAE